MDQPREKGFYFVRVKDHPGCGTHAISDWEPAYFGGVPDSVPWRMLGTEEDWPECLLEVGDAITIPAKYLDP